ncbi:hypothetical protein [Mesorhizobium sp. LNHC221B00]|uniref:hypothetical protein n=1 Tax=Mesorhizobium sp. LNHC221B00 TaxID=1287233 RepID=UPI0012EC4BF6|nr:hypothetical protein [Mesorhizobium sp. LNHC221B00]
MDKRQNRIVEAYCFIAVPGINASHDCASSNDPWLRALGVMAKGWTYHKPVKPYAEESIGRREVIENGHVVRSLAPVPSPFVMSTLCAA